MLLSPLQGAVEFIIGIIQLVHLEAGLQAVFVKTLVVGYKRQTLNHQLNLMPHLRGGRLFFCNLLTQIVYSMRFKTITLSIILLISSLCSGQSFRVKVMGISDGDTFTAINRDNLRLKFRIAGIDAPERRQPFSNVAKRALSDMIHGKTVVVDVLKTDGWGRHVARVSTQAIDDVGARMVEMGLAWSYTEFDTAYTPLEATARQSRIGLWREPAPTPPWEWRKENHKQ